MTGTIPHLGLVAGLGLAWPGGRNYLQTVLRSVAHLRSNCVPLKITVAASETDAAGFDPAILRLADAVVPNDVYTAPRSLFSNFRLLVTRRRLDTTAARFDSFVIRNKFDFVFPIDRSVGRAICAAWIPDFGHVSNPDVNGPDECQSRDARFAVIARQADRVVLSSEDALATYRDRYPDYAVKGGVYRFRCPLPEATLADVNAVRSRYHLPRRYAIICNQFWKHKNHLDVIRAIAGLKSTLPDLFVVCTGDLSDYRNPDHASHVFRSIHESGAADRIAILGQVPRIDQVTLVTGSAFLIQPSSCEGWNTGVEEARSIGKPIILSDIPVHLEQRYVGCNYFRLGDVDSLSAVLTRMWRNTPEQPDEERRVARAEYGRLVLASALEFASAIGLPTPLRHPKGDLK